MRIAVASRPDADRARREARALARSRGLGPADAETVALAVAELAMNLVRHTSGGEIRLSPVGGSRGAGIEVESRDRGPGIADVRLALQDGFTTGGGLGSGLPAVRRLMDEFDIASDTEGTRIVARKWRSRP